MQFRITSSDRVLHSFNYDGVDFKITRAQDMSNAYIVSTRTEAGVFGTMSPEGTIRTDHFVGLVTWISNENKFAFSLNPAYFLPFHILIPEARTASKVWLEDVRAQQDSALESE